MISLYNQCASVHIANKYLSQIAFDLYHMLNDIYQAHKSNMHICNEIETNEIIIKDYDEAKVWCIVE